MKLNELLKYHREQKRLSLHSVRKETRISLTYLEALEAGKWDAFPAEVYLTGFLRKYAAALGLNPEEMVQLYKKELEAVQKEQQEKTKQQTQEKEKEDSLSRYKGFVLAAVLAVLMGWWIFSIQRAPVLEKKKPDPLLPQKKLAGAQVVEAQTLRLGAHVKETVWIRVMGDKKLLFEGFLPAGTQRSWEVNEEFRLRIGNVNSIDFSLNDQPVNARSGAQQDVNEILLNRQTLQNSQPPNHPADPGVDPVPSAPAPREHRPVSVSTP